MPRREFVHTSAAPAAIGPYSQGVVVAAGGVRSTPRVRTMRKVIPQHAPDAVGVYVLEDDSA